MLRVGHVGFTHAHNAQHFIRVVGNIVMCGWCAWTQVVVCWSIATLSCACTCDEWREEVGERGFS